MSIAMCKNYRQKIATGKFTFKTVIIYELINYMYGTSVKPRISATQVWACLTRTRLKYTNYFYGIPYTVMTTQASVKT